jgi:hypothetical protein
MRISPDTFRLLAMLTLEVGVMDFEHASSVLGCSPKRVGPRLSGLNAAGLLTVRTAACRRLRSCAPLAVVSADAETPDLDKLHYAARARWHAVPARPLRIVLAGPAARSLLGVRPSIRRVQLAQLAHDLGLTDARFFHFAARWKAEPRFSGTPKRIDGCLFDSNGQPIRLIEHIASYPKSRIRAAIELAQSLQLPLEIW